MRISDPAAEVLADLGDGTIDISDLRRMVYLGESTEAQAEALREFERLYDSAASDRRLHPDDDFEEIEMVVCEWLQADYPRN